jgi:hypothetical protein
MMRAYVLWGFVLWQCCSVNDRGCFVCFECCDLKKNKKKKIK